MSEFNKKKPLRLFEAFAGYGSQAMAHEVLKHEHPEFEFEVVGIAEIDKYALQAYGAVHGHCPNYGDISKVDWNQVPDFDFFSYSSPCQDFSNAGLQKGGDEGSGTRSSLLWECRRAIEIKRPKYLMLENVKALVSKKFLPLFHKWLKVLEDLGYTNYYGVLNAKDFNVPQNRERIFCISILGEHDLYKMPTPVPLEIRLKDILEEEVDDKYVLSETAIQGFLKHNENHKAKGTGFLWIPKDVDNPGGGNSLTASDQAVPSVQQTIQYESSSVANCLRANASLNATDNTLIQYAKDTN